MKAWWWMVVGAVACGTEPAVGPAAEPAVADVPAAPAPELRETAILKAGPPAEMGPQGKLFVALAEKLGVGIARCPLAGNGKARMIHGMERDYLLEFGALYLTEWTPDQEPPWDFLFDEAIAEQDWATLLVAPGATEAWVTTASTVFAYTFPAAAPGTVVTCTDVAAVPPRVVRVRTIGQVPKDAYATPCGLGKPVPVAADGTVVVDVRAPCTLWFEGPGYRSQKVRVDAGDAPLEVELQFTEDTVLNFDLTWTDAGRKMLGERLADERGARFAAVDETIEALKPAFASDPNATRTLTRWGAVHAQWGRLLDASIEEAKNPGTSAARSKAWAERNGRAPMVIEGGSKGTKSIQAPANGAN